MHAKTKERQKGDGSCTCVPAKPIAHQASNGGEGEVINIKTDEEEEELEDIIIEEDEDEGMEEETEPTYPPTKLLAYIPPRKGKAKVPKDLDESKSSLQTLLLPDDIIFEGMHLERVPNLKF